ncbi:hypothetical protein SKDZ_09G0110 [Saccharomyces kudriavzevii ZP591]|nr:hypothetical protein SKDZ_09G0110 [Saccharomyces kudriavzevii ZP591]
MDARSLAADASKPQGKNADSGNKGTSSGNEGSANKDRNRNRNRNRNKNRNRIRDNNEVDKLKPVTANKEGQNEKSQKKNRRRRNNNETTKKDIPAYSKKVQEDGQKQTAKRQKEIDQCIHVLPDFKLFKKGRHVTSFGYRISLMTDSGKASQKVLFNIPLDYPKTPIKLAMRNNEDVSSYMEIVTANFNWKARQLVKENWEILSQINYLISEFENLKQPEYKQIDNLRNSFYRAL